MTLNSTLQIGGSQETVEVTSEAPQVDTTSTQLGAVINDRSVNELPLNTRDTYQFLQLQPGVQSQLGSSGSLFAGSDDPGFSLGQRRPHPRQQFQRQRRRRQRSVREHSDDRTHARRRRGVSRHHQYLRCRIRPQLRLRGERDHKVGTQCQFHGNVYEYFRNTILDARGYPDTTKPQLNQNQFGGTFGGPIKKDRTFFFLSYEGRRIRDGVPGQLLNVPTG